MNKNRNRKRTLCVKTTPEVKLTYFMYAAQHDMHIANILERIADCLEAGGDMSLRDCLEKGQ